MQYFNKAVFNSNTALYNKRTNQLALTLNKMNESKNNGENEIPIHICRK